MAVLSGSEFHRYADTRANPTHPGEFYRIIQLGKEIHIRSGERGTPGELEIRHFDVPGAAYAELQRQQGHRDWNDVSCTERCRATFRVDATDDPEALFMAYWTDAIFAPLHGEPPAPLHGEPPTQRPRWALITNPTHERGKDHSTDTVLAELESHPHATDEWSDAMVGILPRVPVLRPGASVGPPIRSQLDVSGRYLNIFTLDAAVETCPHAELACEACLQRQAELLLFLCRGVNLRQVGPEERTHMANTARRLVRAGQLAPAR